MRGDFTQDTRRRARAMGTRSLLLQQGRQLLDADWNEQSGLAADRLEATATDAIGQQGAPRDNAGFAITATAAGFSIGPGRLYAQGLLIENRAALAYGDQLRAGLLPALTTIPAGAEALVYLEALTRPASVASDPALAEPGLAGADTVVRETIAWTVRVAPLAGMGMTRAALIDALRHNRAPAIPPFRTTTGGMEADVVTEAEAIDPGPCVLAPSAGYLDQVNRLFRVEIHGAGPRNAATFKWTDEPGFEAGLVADGAGFGIDLPIARAAEWFPTGAIVEVLDSDIDRAGSGGPIGAITSAPGAPLTINGIAAAALHARARVRRWAAAPAPLPAAGTWVTLGRGVRVRFADGFYAAGAAWTIPARTLTGDIIWPPVPVPDLSVQFAPAGSPIANLYFPSDGRRRYAALAIIQRNATGVSVAEDLRQLFPPLTDIHASDVFFEDGASNLGADDVQGAIDALAARRDGCCTISVSPGPNWWRPIQQLAQGAHATICFAAGNYRLDAPLVLANLGHVRMIGIGAGTKIWAYGVLTAFRFEGCASVTVADMAIAAERQAPRDPAVTRRSGALDIENCGQVQLDRVTLIAGGRRLRQVAALRVASANGAPARPGGGDLTVRDCDIVAGDLALGILVINAATVRIIGNRIRPRAEAVGRTLKRWSDDADMAAAMGRIAASHIIDTVPGAGRTRPATRGEIQLWPERTLSYGQRQFSFSFYGNPLVTGENWRAFTAAHTTTAGLTTSRTMRLAIGNLLSNMWTAGGTPVVGRQPFTGFQALFAMVQSTVAPIVHGGIVIGGTRARDVEISGNSIAGAITGIRVALSNGLAQVRLPIDTLRITGNRIRLRAAPVDLARHGIYVGNATCLWIDDNDIGHETVDAPADDAQITRARNNNLDALFAEGIRVHGALGRVLYIRSNVIRRCQAGVTVVAARGSTTQSLPHWIIAENYVENGRVPYRLDNRCRTRENTP